MDNGLEEGGKKAVLQRKKTNLENWNISILEKKF